MLNVNSASLGKDFILPSIFSPSTSSHSGGLCFLMVLDSSLKIKRFLEADLIDMISPTLTKKEGIVTFLLLTKKWPWLIYCLAVILEGATPNRNTVLSNLLSSAPIICRGEASLKILAI